MKKAFFTIYMIPFLFSCSQNHEKVTRLENQVEALKQEIKEAYKPGFGIIMNNIRQHHSKLWFAGKNQNWELAEFEVHEIKERFDDIKKYQKGKKETEMITMIEPFLDSLDKTIEEKDINQFKNNYRLLTNTCNSCHRANNHEFIEIKIPDIQSINNQMFKRRY
jgi:hypothetical protein